MNVLLHGVRVRKMRLAGHRSCAFGVRCEPAYSRVSRVGLKCDVGFRNRLRNCPMAAETASGCLMVRRANDRVCARFFPTQTLGPASMSIRLFRLSAVTAAAHNTEDQKFGHKMAFLVDCLLVPGHSP